MRKCANRLAQLISGITMVSLLTVMTPGPAANAFVDANGLNKSNHEMLPAPFSGWNVKVTPSRQDSNVVELSFDSPRLKKRVTNTVYLPAMHQGSGHKLPVMYYLHGTVAPPLDNCALNPITSQEAYVRMIGCGGGKLQDQANAIQSQLGKMNFIAVSPDTDPKDSVCETCVWINGRNDLLPNIHPVTGKTLPADSFLQDELYPLVETVFDTRRDRGGRGVMGFSGGGWAAALQGMLHPDKYAYIASVSGVFQRFEPELNTVLNGLGFMRDQGYGTVATDEVWYRQYNPADIATNIRGTGTRFFLSSGNGCLKVTDMHAPDCQGKHSLLRAPAAAAVEQMMDRNRAIASKDLSGEGIQHKTVKTSGVHGSNNHRMFADHIVPEANSILGSSIQKPKDFSYRSVLPEFGVWGYHFNVRRSNDEFLSVTNARTDGRSFNVTGNGVVKLATPGSFVPGKEYTVSRVSNGETSSRKVIANDSGRLDLVIDLGKGSLVDENSGTKAVGVEPVRSTTVSIDSEER